LGIAPSAVIAHHSSDKIDFMVATQLVDLLSESLKPRWIANAATAGPKFGCFWELKRRSAFEDGSRASAVGTLAAFAVAEALRPIAD
jgi:hypothetical protein